MIGFAPTFSVSSPSFINTSSLIRIRGNRTFSLSHTILTFVSYSCLVKGNFLPLKHFNND